MMIATLTIGSPIGPLELHADAAALTAIRFDGDRRAIASPSTVAPHTVLGRAARQLAEYFEGSRRSFELPLRPRGSTFQLSVWDRVQAVPYGEVTTYGAIARELDLGLAAARAIGAANGANPIPVVIPCHRVIGASGALTGYAGGLERKRRLIALERGPSTAQLSLL